MTVKTDLSPAWLAARVQKMIEDDCDIDPAENLVLYGLDSIAVMTFSSELKQMGVEASFEELAREPTLDQLHPSQATGRAGWVSRVPDGLQRDVGAVPGDPGHARQLVAPAARHAHLAAAPWGGARPGRPIRPGAGRPTRHP